MFFPCRKEKAVLACLMLFLACPVKGEPDYRTQLSRKGQLDVVRRPPAADYSRMRPGKITELPSYDPDSGRNWQVDVRSSDLSELDLKGRTEDLLHADFDSKTVWPEKLPAGFDPARIIELGKNPGLGLRALHKKGITGKGVGVAVIDQGLLVQHAEYWDRLKLYEEIHCGDDGAQMHGPAVASIAVGKNVGVAPGAWLYYIAETHGVFREGKFEWDLSWLARSIDRVVEINKGLSPDEKIRVISISLGIGGKNMSGSEKALEAVKRAASAGIYTVHVGSDPFFGMGRSPLSDPESASGYSRGEFWKNYSYANDKLLVPMDSRAVASPTGAKDYAFYRSGGMSWAVPYVAGLYALACQVRPDMTPELFWKTAFETGTMTGTASEGKTGKLGVIVEPARLISSLEAGKPAAGKSGGKRKGK